MLMRPKNGRVEGIPRGLGARDAAGIVWGEGERRADRLKMSKLAPAVNGLNVASPLVFCGMTDGALSIEGDAIVGEGAIFRGQLAARRVVILGTFDGTVTARESLHLGPAAVLIGEARAGRFTLEPGAGVEAHVRAGSIEAKAAVAVEMSEAVPAGVAAVYGAPVQDTAVRHGPVQQGQRTTIHAAAASTAMATTDTATTPVARRPEARSAAAVSLDEVERTLAGFEVKLAAMAARAK